MSAFDDLMSTGVSLEVASIARGTSDELREWLSTRGTPTADVRVAVDSVMVEVLTLKVAILL